MSSKGGPLLRCTAFAPPRGLIHLLSHHPVLTRGLGVWTCLIWQVLVDLPALGAPDLAISRRGAQTHVRGKRAPPYGDGTTELSGERLYGAFHLLIRVPDVYEKRWETGGVANGVLRLRYLADEEPDGEVDLS